MSLVALMLVASIPGLVLLLVLVAGIDHMGSAANRRLRLPWRKTETGEPLAAPGLDEMHAIFYATKRHELDQRRTSLVLRDDENDGAPPHYKIDLESGRAIVRKPRSR